MVFQHKSLFRGLQQHFNQICVWTFSLNKSHFLYFLFFDNLRRLLVKSEISHGSHVLPSFFSIVKALALTEESEACDALDAVLGSFVTSWMSHWNAHEVFLVGWPLLRRFTTLLRFLSFWHGTFFVTPFRLIDSVQFNNLDLKHLMWQKVKANVICTSSVFFFFLIKLSLIFGLQNFSEFISFFSRSMNSLAFIVVNLGFMGFTFLPLYVNIKIQLGSWILWHIINSETVRDWATSVRPS